MCHLRVDESMSVVVAIQKYFSNVNLIMKHDGDSMAVF